MHWGMRQVASSHCSLFRTANAGPGAAKAGSGVKSGLENGGVAERRLVLTRGISRVVVVLLMAVVLARVPVMGTW